MPREHARQSKQHSNLASRRIDPSLTFVIRRGSMVAVSI
jgi:hypothetical protein